MTTVQEPDAIEAFAGRLGAAMNDAMLISLIDIGFRTGLFEAAAQMPSVTTAELAAAAGLADRPVQEWLGGLVCGGVIELTDTTPGQERFALRFEVPRPAHDADDVDRPVTHDLVRDVCAVDRNVLRRRSERPTSVLHDESLSRTTRAVGRRRRRRGRRPPSSAPAS